MKPEHLPQIVDQLEIHGRVYLPGVIISLEYRRCGKNCGGCPHGPYVYSRDRGSNRRRYIGTLRGIRKSPALHPDTAPPTDPGDTSPA